MAEGRITIIPCEDTNNNRPHFKGFFDVGGVTYQFAVWPSRSGKGYSGKFKPKEDAPQYAGQVAASQKPNLLD